MSRPCFIESVLPCELTSALLFPRLLKQRRVTHNLAESWNRGVIGYFRTMTSVGNPGDCMPGLVARDNRPFCIARFRSCGPALARFRRVVNAISAKRLSFSRSC